MRSESSFERQGSLIVVKALAVGLNAHSDVLLVLDTGSALTTLSPEIAAALGYSEANRVARSIMRSAVGEERGYIVQLNQLTALGHTVSGVHVVVVDLGYDIDGLLGMNFLDELNFEVRIAEQRILAEKIAR